MASATRAQDFCSAARCLRPSFVSVYSLARRPADVAPHSPLTHPSASSRWSAGKSDPALISKVPRVTCLMRSAIADAVLRTERERPEDEQIERALQEAGLRHGHSV